MRISVQLRNGDSFDRTIRVAVEVLRATNSVSPTGQCDNHRAIVLIDPVDLPSALRVLEREGIRASVN